MSGTSRDPSSSDVENDKYVTWLGTYYFDLPHSIANMSPDVIWKSQTVKPTYVDILFQFQFVRVSELDFHVTCLRYHGTSANSSTPSGYTLEFQCSINHFSNDDPKIFEMQSHEFVVMERYSLDASYQQLFSPADLEIPFQLKILIKMAEYDCAQNDIRIHQNDHLFRWQDRWFNFTAVLQDLAYIMRIPRFENIFTGRQDMAFSDAKTIYIKNAAYYSKEMADYMRALDAMIPVPSTDLGLILNFVLNGKREQIVDEDLFEGYIVGHHMGLAFIVELTRELIMLKLPTNVTLVNQTFLIDALRVADRVNDWILIEAVARKFDEWERELENPEALFDLLKSRGIKGQFMLYTLRRRRQRWMAEAGPHLPAEVGESSQSSPKTYITL